MPMNVLITGGTGLVGKAIIHLLEETGYSVAVLSRNRNIKSIKSFHWDVQKEELDEAAIDFADIIIHLAGENISSKRWTEHQKVNIIDSRVKSTNLIFQVLERKQKKLKAFISASAIGYYGTYTSDKIFEEEDQSGYDFLAETVIKWEESVKRINTLGIPINLLRIGVVMSLKGGALTKMLAPVKMGIGSAIGSGKQWMPWIALEDLASLFLFLIEKGRNDAGFKGIQTYNAVSPNKINNKMLMKSLAKSLKMPFIMPAVPAFVFKLIYGEMSMILLEGSRVSSEKILKEGFEFKYHSISDLFSK